MFAILLGVLIILLAFEDSFQAMVLPRRVTHRWRPTRLYYRACWGTWRFVARAFPAGPYRETTLSVFGPLSLLGLFACWVTVLICGFGLVHWGAHTLPSALKGEDLQECMYFSGETFFTLGYGDVTPEGYPGKLLSVVEAGTGFGFMALIIGYLPVLYQAFSRREQDISLLDARAGSPPTAGEFLRRVGFPGDAHEMERFLAEWELWSANLLESHLSFPVLSFYRSQHDNQSWLAALAVVLDASAVQVVTGGDRCRRRAELTFAMARHACVDLCLVFWLPPIEPGVPRLTDEETKSLHGGDADVEGLSTEQARRLAELRGLYEPFLQALSEFFCFRVPRFFRDHTVADNWQTSAWTKRAPGITELPAGSTPADRHFG